MKKLFTILIPLLILFSSKSSCLPMLSSLPTAQATIFLDFDGQYVQSSLWNGGMPLACAPSGLTDAQIIEIFNRVSEDFRPFNLDITTDSTKFLSAPLNRRVRIIVTPTSGWYAGVGGVSYTGSFTWGDDTPGFVFPDRLGPYDAKDVAECCTHESGHTVGLSHQAKYDGNCNLLATYNTGVGTGETAWAPVMGNSYYRNFSGWYNGPTPYGCAADQDALSIITSSNGFTYRADDHSDDPNINASAISINNTLFADSGIITTSSDKDVFKFNLTEAGQLHINANPFSVGPSNAGADLDVKLQLLNSSLQVLQVYDPVSTLNAIVDTTLTSGVYFLVVQGAGNTNTSNYGSLGSYTISGTFSPLLVMPIKQVTLSGKADKDKHIFSWSIVTDEPVSSLTLESSANGTNFTTLVKLPQGSQTFSYVPSVADNIYYRLKAVSATDQAIYSNVISLKSDEASKLFKVSTMVYSEVTVNASQDYSYKLADVSGRIIQAGKGKAGINNINISNSPNGIYLIQIISNNQRLTERIVKL
ncbi:MAG TPA: T9SS type A sorting domain-containing protein [Ginsengibacter sp.]|nr:T9SS type A sorting domain-containing protein [Ginsengibacter sp.]